MEFSADQLDELWRGRLQAGQRAGLTVASDSMAPLVRVGDRIIVERYAAGQLPRLGDIVLFDLGGGWVVHRIIGSTGSEKDAMYRQRGDAGHKPALAAASSVAGRVVRIERQDGTRVDLVTRRQRIINGFLGRFFYAVDTARRSSGKRDSGLKETAGGLLSRVERTVTRVAVRFVR